VKDTSFDAVEINAETMKTVAEKAFPVQDDMAGEKMQAVIAAAREKGDSVGGIVECAVTGVPDDVRGQIVKATIVLAKEYVDYPDKDALIKEIQNHVKKVSAPYKYPRVVDFVTELPKTISGKIRRVEIRQKDAAKE
jgi:acyl-CoA synthetase (AMP-forming)/AMP-acid ligase II